MKLNSSTSPGKQATYKSPLWSNFVLEIMRDFCIFLLLSSVAWFSFCHEISTECHDHFRFSSLVDAVNDDFLVVNKLFEKLHFENCSALEAQNQTCLRVSTRFTTVDSPFH